MSHWDFEITALYNQRGAAPGQVAMITVHKGEASRDMELAVFRSRDDIGEVKVRDLRLTPRPALTTPTQPADDEGIAMSEREIVERRGGWFVADEVKGWSGPWNTRDAAVAARAQQYDLARKRHSEAGGPR